MDHKAQPQHQCIWCKESKSESAFNVEHVMPQAFGTFEQNFTLIDTVCADCNGFFSRELEPWLSRDSLEGFDRYRYGDKNPADFKSQGARSTSRVQIPEGPYAGAWGFTVPGQERLGATPFPQVGFAKAGAEEYEWFLLDGLPTRDELKGKGYEGACHLRLCECDAEDAKRRLAEKGIDCEITETFEPPSGGMWLEQVFRPGVSHKRALAKIAVNYIAYHFGAEVVLDPAFDAMRAFVMEGIEPPFEYYAIDENPVIEGDKQNGQRFLGHAVVASPYGDGIQVVVSLYNRFRHGIRLTTEGGHLIEPRGHFFDTGNRVIHLLTPSGA